MRDAQAVAFADLLKQYRVRAHLSQEELAERARLSVRAISDLERGLKQRPRNATVRLLVEALGLLNGEQAAFEAAANGKAPPIVPAPRAHNLPVQLTSFVGRANELVAVVELLLRRDVHLVTLTGPGGAGKTRLAVRVVEEALLQFVDGVCFVDLSAVSDPALVSLAIAQALRVQEASSASLLDALALRLRDRHMLLVLDNFEQVVLAAPVATQLLAACPGLKVLATSRVTLRVRGEQVYSVPPLTQPDPMQPISAQQLGQYEAVQLFLARAQAVKPEFQITNENAPALAEICRQLDGLPLAIELAAARAKLLPPHVLLQQLAHPLQVLTRGPRDVPERQQTLRATIGWSYALLSAAEQRLFRRLAVFVGGCTMEALAAVGEDTAHAGNAEQEPGAGASVDGDRRGHGAKPPPSLANPLPSLLDQVASLVDKSLLRADEAGGELRFMMLELIRGFALGQLELSGEAETLRQRHAAYYLGLAKEAAPELAGGPEQIVWFRRVAAELDNFRAVLHRAVEHREVATALQLGTALREFWMTRGYLGEGRRWLEAALTLADEAGESVSEALRGSALTTTGWLAANGRDYTVAERLFEQSLALARRAEDPQQIIAVLGDLGQAARMQHDLKRAVALYDERVILSRELGDARGLAWALCNLGMIAYTKGDPRVGSMLEEGVTAAQSIGDQVCIAWCLTFLARVTKDHGEHAQAGVIFAHSLKLFRDLGHADGIAYTLEGCAGLAATRGDFRSAARLFGAAEALREVINRRQPPDHFDLAAADAVADGAAWQADWAEGRMLPVEQAIADALEQNEDPSAVGSFPVPDRHVPASSTDKSATAADATLSVSETLRSTSALPARSPHLLGENAT